MITTKRLTVRIASSQMRQGIRSRQDHRTRRDRILRRTEAFRCQLDSMTKAYLEWCTGGAHTRDPTNVVGGDPGMRILHLTVVSVFSEYT